uniref:Ycf2 protein n=1 Tax=Cuscuta mexicana TaxID=1197930 RepID=A0A4Y6GU98_9ASTE|nr:Ycf2 protein [Cuscuta mexicana]YP_009673755.1 Ycf2 protein [Cuscuta mexicana]QDF46416.1 Ycf2 protein [Cuscuta mexicana]QDF46417.1 Ycf2 protein [Cuscuta mexicana]
MSILLLSFPKGKTRSENYLLKPKENTEVLPITKVRWRNLMENRSFHETVAGSDIIFKEKALQSLEFPFVYYLDDKDPNLESRFKILVKSWISYLMPAFREKIPQEGLKSNRIEHVSDLFSRKGGTISLQNCTLFYRWQFHQDLFFHWGNDRPESYFFCRLNKDRFFSKGRNIWSNLQSASTRSRSHFVQGKNSSTLKRSSDQPIDLFDSLQNENSEYSGLIHQKNLQQRKERASSWDPSFLETEREISQRFPEKMEHFRTIFLGSFCSERCSELYITSTPIERATKDPHFAKKPLCFVRRAEKKELLHLFKIILYLQKTVSIHSISSDLAKKNLFFSLVQRFYLKVEEIMQERADLWTLLISEPDMVYHKEFSFYLNRFDQTKLLNEILNNRAELKRKSLWVWSRYQQCYPETHYFFKRVRQKMVGFVSNSKNRMKLIRQHQWIQNDSSISFSMLNLFNRSNRNQIPREQKVTALLNYRTRMNYKIKQDYPYRYKWSNSIMSLQEQFELFLSEQKNFFQVQKSRFEGTFEVMQVKFGELHFFFIRFPGKLRGHILRLRVYIFEKWIYWSEVRKYIEKKVQKRVYVLIPYLLDKLFKALRSFFSPHSLVGLFTKIFGFSTQFLFFWANSPIFYCVTLGNTPIQRSKIYIYELQGPTHKLCNQLLESIGFKMVHLKRLNPFLVEESSPSNFVVNGAITSPNKLPKRMIDSLHTRTKSFYKKDSDFFKIFHDQENWLNPANPFQRSSLIYSFYKANRLRFMNNPACFWFDCKTRFPFSVERTWNTHFNFLYGQFLNSLFLRKKIVSLCGGKKHSSPIEAQVDLKLISQDFHSDPVIGRAIYSIIETSATPLTETQIVNLERTSCQPFLDLNMNLSDSEAKNFYEFPNFISKMGLSHSPYSESIHFDRKEKGTSFQRDSFVSLLSEKWNLFQRYLPSFFTLAGYKYINLIFSDLVSRVLASSWRILQIELGKMPFFITIESLRKGGFNNFLLGLEIMHRNTSVKMFYLKTFFVLFVGYLITMHLFFVLRTFIKLHKKLKSLNSFMSSSSRIEVRKLLDKYPMSEPNDFCLKNLFSDIMTRIAFSINVIKLSHISHISKDIYSLLRKRKNVNWEWIDDQIESWVANTNSIHEEESKFLVQLATLTTEKSVLLSLTHSDHLSKNDAGYKILEQPGALHLRDLVDIQQKHLINYEFNTACLAERRIFLAHSQAITYSQRASHGKPFSLRLNLSPSRGSLVIGSIGTGRSYLVKTLATNSYLPFITIFVNKLLDKNPPQFLSDIDRVEKSDNIDPSYDIDRVEKSDSIDDEIGRDLATELDLLTWNALTTDSEMTAQIDQLSITLQFELARAMSPCIIWIPNIHDLDVNEANSLALGLLVNQLSRDCERCSPRNNLVIASTHLPQKVDPALIAPKKLNTCIKLRRLLSSQQRKSFFILSSTRGFHLEKKMFHTYGFRSITMGPNARDIVALTNEVLSISITQKKSIIDTNTIRSALHRQTWDLQSQVRLVQDHGILFYQIGRAVAQNLLLSDCPIDPISIYLKKKSCNERDSYLYKWYFELGRSMKKLTILLYILSCSAGSVAQDLWSLPGNNGITSYGLVENDSYLVHGLLEVEGALVGSSSILDQRFLYESEFEESPQQIEEDLLNNIIWAPRLWGFMGVSYEENDSESGTMQYKTSSKEFILDPFFFLFKDQPPGSRRELFADEEMAKALLTSQIEHMFLSKNTRFFSQEKHFEFLIHRQKWLRTKSSLSNGSFLSTSNTLSESYQYLSNLFLSNGTLLDQLTKTLLRKRWLFPDEMKIGFM